MGLNARAAKEIGIETAISLDDVDPDKQSKENAGGWNPFSKLAANIQSAQDIAKATASGDVLTIAGAGGTPVRLIKSKVAQEVDIKMSMGQEEYTRIGTSQVYIGDLPGLAALEAWEVKHRQLQCWEWICSDAGQRSYS